MKFHPPANSKLVDPSDESVFTRPVKLNRKDPRTVRRLTDQDRERHNLRALQSNGGGGGAMEVDPKEEEEEGDVKEEEGEVKKEKERLDLNLVGKGTSGSAGAVASARSRGPGGMFKKKTRRVFVASEESRRLKREEWQPWVLEDDQGTERWVGRLEGGAGEVDVDGKGKGKEEGEKGEKGGNASLKGWRPAAISNGDAGGGGSSYVAFVFGENGDEFEVVPINRWYKFNQGPKYLTLAEEEAEEEVSLLLLSLHLFLREGD